MNKIDEYCKIINIQQNEILNNSKQEFRYFCYQHIDLIKNIKLPELYLNLDNEVVLIEFRILPHLEFLLHNTINKIGNSWSYTIVCGIDNYDFMKQLTDKLSANIKIIKLEYNNINIDQYNELLTSVFFWNLFIGSKILLWQEDSCVFGSNINDFIKAIKIELSDLERLGKEGYVEGFSRIILEKLKEINIYKRPLHCSDAKRETMYIKENNVWNKDESPNNEKMIEFIKAVEQRNYTSLLAYADEYPEVYKQESKRNVPYLHMAMQSNGTAEKINKVMKRIIKEVVIDKEKQIS